MVPSNIRPSSTLRKKSVLILLAARKARPSDPVMYWLNEPETSITWPKPHSAFGPWTRGDEKLWRSFRAQPAMARNASEGIYRRAINTAIGVRLVIRHVLSFET